MPVGNVATLPDNPAATASAMARETARVQAILELPCSVANATLREHLAYKTDLLPNAAAAMLAASESAVQGPSTSAVLPTEVYARRSDAVKSARAHGLQPSATGAPAGTGTQDIYARRASAVTDARERGRHG
jgi:hypothetical protein